MANQIGKALASARIATPPNLDDAGHEWESFKRSTQGYIWGAPGALPNGIGASIEQTVTWEGEGDNLRAYPHVFPVAGTITKIVWYLVTDMIAGQALRWAIYSDDGNLYPANKVFDTGSMSLVAGSSSNGHGRVTHTPNIHVDANTVLWIVWSFNQAFSPSPPDGTNDHIATYDALASKGLLGYNYPTLAQLVSNNRICHGWILSSAYTNGMPSPFTAGAQLLTYAGTGTAASRVVPLFLLGFTADS